MKKHSVNDVAGAGIAAATMRMDWRTQGIKHKRYIIIVGGVGTLCADIIGSNLVYNEHIGAVALKGGRG